MKNFDQKNVVITGAGSGIGNSLALEFATLGARLALFDINPESLQKTVTQIHEMGGEAWGYLGDVSKEEDIKAFSVDMLNRFGSIDILVNNAGIGMARVKAESISSEHWIKIMGINFWGTVFTTSVFLPHLQSRSISAIVNIASAYSLVGVSHRSAYCASKFALRGYSESLGQELLSKNVEVYTVHPGAIQTNITRHGIGWEDPIEQESAARVLHQISQNTARNAAKTIIRGIEKGNKRILIGSDAFALDILARWLPTLHTRILRFFLSKMESRLMKKIQQQGVESKKALEV